MKKFFAFAAIFTLLALASNRNVYAQTSGDTTQISNSNITETNIVTDETKTQSDGQFHKVLLEKFIEGGPLFMSFILIAFILGLAIAIERIIYLNLADVNTEKLILEIEKALDGGGVEAAKEVCRNTRGPVASIFYQGLNRANQGIEVVEKSVISYGSVQMGLLERGLTWISLFIALAPMLGFLGTVIGMVMAFDNIERAGDINPGLVARGIKIALITTIGGLIVAMILQVFYNYIVSKVDTIVNDMEDSSIKLVDILFEHQNKQS
jgi:biopolymer transport protein ExbB